MLPLTFKVFFFKTDGSLLLRYNFSFFELKLRVKSQAKEYTFTPEINTCEVLSKHGTMDREVPFKVSICDGVPPIGKDATGLISWDDTKIISNDSAALHPKYTTQADGFFDSTGGMLSTALHSDLQIIIGNGAIAEGDPQRLFFGVICDETAPLQDILEGNTLISPVIECGPHDICLLKPVEIILPHCLDLKDTKKKWISVYRTDTGSIHWVKIPSESEKTDESKAWFIVKRDSIHIKTTTFSLWSVFACGRRKKKRATVYSSKPDPESDLIYLRFYVYNDNENSRKRVEMKEKERFPDSKPAREKPFKLYNNNKEITVKLTNIEKGWELDKTNEEQIYRCGKAHGRRIPFADACDFAVRPEEGRVVKGFSCKIEFRQDGDDVVHEIYLNPGFRPLKKLEPVNSPRQNFAESNDPKITSHTSRNCNSAAGSSTSLAPKEAGRDNFGKKLQSCQGLNKSQSVKIPRQTQGESGGLEVPQSNLRRIKSAYGRSRSRTAEEGDRSNLDEQSKTSQDSKPLSSLLEVGPYLERVCNSLDTKMPGVGHYYNVCLHYEVNSYQVSAIFEKHNGGPSKALLEHLAASKENLTVSEFAGVVRETANRGDVVKILEEYDNQ